MTLLGAFLSRWEFYLSVFALFIISRIIKWLKDPLRNIPGPRGYPIIGSTLDYSYRNDLLKVLLERFRKYGTVYKEWGYFGGTTVNISDPKYAKWVLVTNSHNYYRQETLVKLLPALGTGVLTANGKAHANMRKQLNPMFTAVSVKEYMSVFNDKSNQLVKYIKEKMQGENEKSCEMEMLQKFSDLTLDVIGVCAFGYDFDGILGEISEEGKATNTILTANFNVVRKVLEDIFPLLKLIPSKERNELRKAEDIFYGLINKVIAARKLEMESHSGETVERQDLLHKLISMYQEAGLSISNKDLFHQIFTFMIAGHETTSLSMTWFIFLLAKYHHYQPRLRQEIKEAMDGRSEITFDSLDKLQSLDNFIKETMRLYPVALSIGRQAKNADKIGPYSIPPGTRVFVQCACLSRSPEHWKNPDEFNPDRFDVQGEHDPMFPYYFMPCSRGPRMCIGYRFAQMEMKVVLAQLLKSFSFKLAKSQSPDIGGRNILTYMPFPSPLIEITQI